MLSTTNAAPPHAMGPRLARETHRCECDATPPRVDHTLAVRERALSLHHAAAAAAAFFFFFKYSGTPGDLPSSPTRRSSDLGTTSPSRAGRRCPAGSCDRASRCTRRRSGNWPRRPGSTPLPCTSNNWPRTAIRTATRAARSEEHTSELQSPCNLVCRLLLEKK